VQPFPCLLLLLVVVVVQGVSQLLVQGPWLHAQPPEVPLPAAAGVPPQYPHHLLLLLVLLLRSWRAC
jgi:hypothetical protein